MNFDWFNGEYVSFSINDSSSSSSINPNEYYHFYHHYNANASVLLSSYPPSTLAGVFAKPPPRSSLEFSPVGSFDQGYIDAAGAFEPNMANSYPNGSSSSSSTSTTSSPMMIYEPEAPRVVPFGSMPDVELSGLQAPDRLCDNSTTAATAATAATEMKGGAGRVNKVNANAGKGQWTAEEDRLLVGLVDKYGLRRWSHIAQMLDGRIGKQCRERWHNHLRPNIKKDSWTVEEDMILIQAHSETGNKWSEIAKRLPGRTENSIKNHWNATKRRQFPRRGRGGKSCKHPKPGTLLQNYIKSLLTGESDAAAVAPASAQRMHAAAVASTTPAADGGHGSGDQVDAPEVYDVVRLFEQLGCGPTASGVRGPGMETECWAGAAPSLVRTAASCEDVKKEMDLIEMMSQNDKVIQNLS